MLSFERGQPDPARGERGAEIAVREQRHIRAQSRKARDHAVDAGANFNRRLPVGASVC